MGRIALLLPLALLATAEVRADIRNGADLHRKNCIGCHAELVGEDGSGIYTRPDRRVRSLAELHRQVNRCKENLSLTWFDDEVKDVTDYLNATYYRFKP